MSSSDRLKMATCLEHGVYQVGFSTEVILQSNYVTGSRKWVVRQSDSNLMCYRSFPKALRHAERLHKRLSK